ncbi:hypothetical protein FHS27_004606 [Rhodopirellula rubra]|uniref:Uncharacterized protein n=1 Tax=Aporhodopirellula rubra TaxID=980271 RepID=A0A7W5E229_9BACT|nr:hypothetical protein [Aporhodopirellula rubra]MBB3208773.1 hypothetical protein [Aporhodopirellula rubra]
MNKDRSDCWRENPSWNRRDLPTSIRRWRGTPQRITCTSGNLNANADGDKNGGIEASTFITIMYDSLILPASTLIPPASGLV